MQPNERRQQVLALEAKPDQLSHDAPVTPVEDANHDLLTDIAAFRERDRAALNPRLERNNVVVHVDAEEWIAGLDPGGGYGRLVDMNGSRALETRDKLGRAGGIDVDREARHAELIDTRDDDGCSVVRDAHILKVGPVGQTTDVQHVFEGT